MSMRARGQENTFLIDIIPSLGLIGHNPGPVWIIREWKETFCQDDEFLPRNTVFLDSFCNQFLRNTLPSVELNWV
jgi:hypothetical protein